MAGSFDPYLKWLGIPPEHQPPDHYRLLGIPELIDDRDVISHAVDRQMAHLRTLQSSQHAASSQKILNEIAAAKICLLDPDKKSAYDRQLAAANPARTRAVAELPAWWRWAAGAGIAAMVLLAAVVAMALFGDSDSGKSASHETVLAPVLPPTESVSGEDPARAGQQQQTPSSKTLQPESRPVESPATDDSRAATNDFIETSDDSTTVLPVLGVDHGTAVSDDAATDSRGVGQLETDTTPEAPTDDHDSADFPAELAVDQAEADLVGLNEPETGDDESSDAPSSSLPDTIIEDHTGRLPAGRLPAPDAAAQQAAMKVIRELYYADYEAATTQQQQRELAERLFAESLSIHGDPPGRFALLRLTRDVATKAGDVETALGSIDQLANDYEIETLQMTADMLIAVSKSAKLAAEHGVLVPHLRKTARQAVDADRFDLATSLGELALASARKLKEPKLIRELVEWNKSVDEKKAVFVPVAEALKTLDSAPMDPEANLTVGRYRCFIKDDWQAGLPMLALSRDAALKRLAERELAPIDDDTDRLTLADAWWACAAASKSEDTGPAKRRAMFWYVALMPRLVGLEKTRVEKRLEEVWSSGDSQRYYLDDLQEAAYSGSRYYNLGKHASTGYRSKRSPDETKFQFNGTVPQHALSLRVVAGETTEVTYALAKKYQQFVAAAAIREAAEDEQERLREVDPVVFRIFGDEKLLWESGPIAQPNESRYCSLDVRGIDQLTIRLQNPPSSDNGAFAALIDPYLVGPRETVSKQVYLDDLEEIDFYSFTNLLGKRGSTGLTDRGARYVPRCTFRGQAMAHSLAVHPTSRSVAYVSYALNGNYNKFTAIVALMDSQNQLKAPIVFRVFGDDKLLWQSEQFGRRGVGQKCEVDIVDVRILKLEVQTLGSPNYPAPVWINPLVSK